jgi:Protein of unknown function (DUF669)
MPDAARLVPGIGAVFRLTKPLTKPTDQPTFLGILGFGQLVSGTAGVWGCGAPGGGRTAFSFPSMVPAPPLKTVAARTDGKERSGGEWASGRVVGNGRRERRTPTMTRTKQEGRMRQTMRMPNLDFSGPSHVPEGRYRVRVEAVDIRPSKSGTYPYLSWTLVVTEGPYKNSRVYFCSSLSPKAQGRLPALFHSFGVYELGMSLVTDDRTKMLMQPRVIGLSGTATVEEYVWQGKTRTRACDLRGDAQGASSR